MNMIIRRRWLLLVSALTVIAFGLTTGPILRAQVVVEEEVEGSVAEPGTVESDKSGAAAGTVGELKTIAMIAVARHEELLKDVNFVGSLVGQPAIGQLIDMQLAFFTQSIDRTRPFGVVLQTDGMQFLPIACMPVTKPDDLLAVVPAFGAQVTDSGDGVKLIKLSNGQAFYVKSTGGWSYLAQSAESLARVPSDPGAEFAKLVADYDIAANVSLKNIPEMYRGLLLQAIQGGMQESLKKNPEESEDQFEARRELTEGQMKQVVDLINEMDTLTFGWAIDGEAQKTFLDVSYAFVEGGKMATQLAAMEQLGSSFSGFYQPNAVATLVAAQKVDMSKVDAEWYKSQQAQARQMMGTFRTQMVQKLKAELDAADQAAIDAIDSATNDIFDAVLATMESGKQDAGAALDIKPGALKLVAGAAMGESAKIEGALQKLSSVASSLTYISAIEMNVAKHGDVAFHRVTVNVPEDQADVRDVLGEQVELAIGIAPEAVYLGLGQDHMAALTQAIDASAAEPDKSVPMFELAVSLGPIMEIVATQAEEGQKRELAQSIATTLGQESKGLDHLRMTGQTMPNGLRYRIELEEGVLRAIGKAALHAQQMSSQ